MARETDFRNMKHSIVPLLSWCGTTLMADG